MQFCLGDVGVFFAGRYSIRLRTTRVFNGRERTNAGRLGTMPTIQICSWCTKVRKPSQVC
jgi:hypothetical protein